MKIETDIRAKYINEWNVTIYNIYVYDDKGGGVLQIEHYYGEHDSDEIREYKEIISKKYIKKYIKKYLSI